MSSSRSIWFWAIHPFAVPTSTSTASQKRSVTYPACPE